jgi:predicted site-specific integrase-resolvase
MEQSKPTTFYSKPALAQRYSVSSRTIDRWRTDGLFPAPDLVLPNGAPRWSDETVEQHERKAVAKTASS